MEAVSIARASFMAKVGLGGLCPNCEEPVTVDELLAT
jgi:hypothetical protein